MSRAERLAGEQLITTSAGQLAVATTEGVRGNVLLVHGNSSCKEIFANQIQALSNSGFATAAIDLPGHGASSDAFDPQATYTFSGYAKSLCDVIDVLGWTRYVVIGWSLGGHVALELMAGNSRPEACLIAGTPPINPSLEEVHNAFYTSGEMSLAGKRDFDPNEARTYGVQILGSEALLTPFLLSQIMRTDGRAREIMVTSVVSGVGIKAHDLVRSSSIPLCVVHGGRDPFVRLSYLQSVPYHNLWRGDVQVLNESGHAPHCEMPRQFNEIMLAFLDDVVGARG